MVDALEKIRPERLDKTIDTTDICNKLLDAMGGPEGLGKELRQIMMDERSTPYIRLQAIRTVLEFAKFEGSKKGSPYTEKLALMSDEELMDGMRRIVSRRTIDVEANGQT